MKVTKDDLARAVFDNDAVSRETGNGIAIVSKQVGTTPGAVTHVARQRAMRLMIVNRGPDEQQRLRDQTYAREFVVEDFTEDEEEQMVHAQAIWLDGCLAGMRAIREAMTKEK